MRVRAPLVQRDPDPLLEGLPCVASAGTRMIGRLKRRGVVYPMSCASTRTTVAGAPSRLVILRRYLPLLLSLAACKAKEGSAPGAGGAATASATTAHLKLVDGSAASLHEYLTTVDTIRGAKVDVVWAPETGRMGGDAGIRALWGVSD